LKVTTINFSFICGMMLGFEYVDPEMAGVHTLVIDVMFVRIMIQHGEVEDFEQ
jgi:hypothetical protein